ncbi:MAG: methyltransferase domain-containing protein [Bacteroidota bacterium]
MEEVKEGFKPKAHVAPDSFFNKIKFSIRLVLDFQVNTVYAHLKPFLSKTRGDLLDLGCGESPYRFLINENQNKYFGLDIADADKFDYSRKDIMHFDGKNIPFENERFDYLICTEVLEHVEDYQSLVNEVHRVMKTNGEAIFTIPWSARYHYIPYDYYRYTPSKLKAIFLKFSKVEITPRGTDVTSISAKIVVLFFRNIFPQEKWTYIFSPIWILFSPLLIISILFGHISLITGFGSDLDPLGYAIKLKK